jgi:hypothetical protein
VSASYFLVCHKCRVALNLASWPTAGFRVTADTRDLGDFLFEHRKSLDSHPLELLHEQERDRLDYESLPGKGD